MALCRVILFSAVWISLCAVALAVESCLILELPLPDWRRLAFAFAVTCCHYNLHYLFRTPEPLRSRRDRWLVSHRPAVVGLSFAMGVAALWLGLSLTVEEILIVASAAVVSALYSLPLLPRGWRLRDLGLLKPIFLALVWAIVTVWLPAHAAEPHLLLLVGLRRFVFMLMLCLAFDVRDVEKDAAHGVRTMPVRWGIPLTHRVIEVLLVFFVVLAGIVELDKQRPAVAVALALSALISAMTIRWARASEEYYLAIIDGMMLLQAGLVALAVV